MFIYHGENLRIKEAVAKANNMGPDIIMSLNDLPDVEFKWSNVTPKKLGVIIASSKLVMEVRTYWYWSKNVNGKFLPSQPNIIWINTRGRVFNNINPVDNGIPGLISLKWHEKTHIHELFFQ